VRADRQRVAEMVAIREGREPPAPDPTTARFLAAARTDATGCIRGVEPEHDEVERAVAGQVGDPTPAASFSSDDQSGTAATGHGPPKYSDAC
jgi:hypothetical protein